MIVRSPSPRLAVAVGGAEIEDARQFLLIRDRRQMEVDESGPGDLDLCDQFAGRQRIDHRLRQLARILARGLRELQRDVGREVAVRRIARTFDFDDGQRNIGRQHLRRQRCQRGLQQLFDLDFQSATSGTKSG